jgi:hypothetical protein
MIGNPVFRVETGFCRVKREKADSFIAFFRYNPLFLHQILPISPATGIMQVVIQERGLEECAGAKSARTLPPSPGILERY